MVRRTRRLVTVVVTSLAAVLSASQAFAASAPAPSAAASAYRPPVAAARLVVCVPGVNPTDPVGRRLVPDCAYHDIQSAVDAVRQRGTTIYVLSGHYREKPISVSGDSTSCARCDLQLEGIGSVAVDGDSSEQAGVLAYQANGLYVKNIAFRGFARDGIEVDATDGFVLDQVSGDANGRHGIDAVGSDHGIITGCEASGNADAGIATTSASDVRGARSTIEIRGCRSSNNVIGYSGTAGDSVYVHDNDFFANSTGISMDSQAPVAGMPQNHASFVANRIYSNNADFYQNVWKGLCGRPGVICPVRPVPVGTGLLLAGGDENTYAGNLIYDNWRYGAAQYWVPPSRRGSPSTTPDTSDGNRYLGNLMGFTPAGAVEPNGLDFWWDEQGTGNCWQNNAAFGSRTDPAALPNCGHPSAGGPYTWAGNPVKNAIVNACAAYRWQTRTGPAGCPWLGPPAKPQAATG